MKKFALLTAVAAVSTIASMAHAAAITVATVGTYASNPTPLNIVNAGAYTGQVSLSTFTSDLSAAFAANNGGDITFDTGFTPGSNYGDGSANQITATYGTSQGNSVGVYRSDISGLSTASPQAFFAIQPNTNNGTNVTSGTGYLGWQGVLGTAASGTQDANNGGNLVFTKGLSELGLNLVGRAAARVITMTAILDDASTLVSSTNTSNGDNTATTPSVGGTTSVGASAIFYGFVAPVGRTIVGLRVNEATNSFARFDDLAFIVATPEPASLSMLGLGGLALLRRRRA